MHPKNGIELHKRLVVSTILRFECWAVYEKRLYCIYYEEDYSGI